MRILVSVLQRFGKTDYPLVDKWQHHVTLETFIWRVRRILRREYLLNLLIHLFLVSVLTLDDLSLDFSK